MKLNPEILTAIRSAIDYYGNSAQFAKEIGVAHSTVLFWLRGKTTSISGSVWDKKVRRVLNRFMPKSPQTLTLRDAPQPYSCTHTRSGQKKQHQFRVPAIPFSKMIEMDITMQSPVSFVSQRRIDEVPFASDCSEYSFALILDKPNFCPSLPVGSWMLIGGFDYARNGDLTVGKARNPDRLFFCRYYLDNGKISLVPLNPELPVMEWNADENAERIFWIFPIKEISINLELCSWKGNSLIRKTAQSPA